MTKLSDLKRLAADAKADFNRHRAHSRLETLVPDLAEAVERLAMALEKALERCDSLSLDGFEERHKYIGKRLAFEFRREIADILKGRAGDGEG